MISFVGAGPGAADLLTLRGARRLAEADVVVWASSLVSPVLLDHCRAGVELHDSKSMTLEEVTAVYAAHPVAAVVRLHSGDPSVYGAIAEQIDWCIAQERAFEIVPGVSSVAAAAAAAGHELTVPGLAQSVVLTRLAHRTAGSVPARESVAGFARLGPTMALFLSAGRPDELQAELVAAGSAYDADTPALIAHRVSWPDERLVRSTVGRLAEDLRALEATTTVLVLVGDALGETGPPRRSHVYAPGYAHSFRPARPAPGRPGDGRAIDVVGLLGGVPYGAAARQALGAADVVVGSPRQLAETAGPPPTAERIPLRGPLDGVLSTIEQRADRGDRVCVLASGDPGFFGIVRALGARVGPDRLAVHPAPSSVAVAFARLGRSWDDAAVVSAHGRPLEAAVEAAARADKVAVLTSPDNPPEALGEAVRAAGLPVAEVAVVSRIGDEGERVHRTDVDGLANGRFDPLSVVILLRDRDGARAGAPPSSAGLAWGLPETRFAHRGGMITKSETRAVALGKLALPATGVLWDLGAGSGSVGVECARLAPGLEVVAVERDADQVARIRANAEAHGVDLRVVEGTAPEVLADLPDPDRVFVGGGGVEVLDAALARLRPGGVVVATYTLVDRAVAAEERLGNLVQLNVSRSAPVGAVGFRLAPENPVFVCWGPSGP